MTEVSTKTAQLFRLCLLGQYDKKHPSTVSANEEKKCLVKSGKVN
jgi:hypothetical protein